MRRALPWAALVAGLLACMAVAWGAYALAGYSWDQVVSYESPYLEGGDGADGPVVIGPPQARRLVLVIVDGLRLDASLEMMSFQGLRARGSDLVAVTPQPSLSYPTWTTILSGAPNAISGVTTNWYDRRVLVETLIDLELAAGRRVVIVGPPDFEKLYRTKGAAAVATRAWDGEPLADWMAGRAVDLAEAESADFVLVHVPDIDEAGHDHGGTSREYREAVARVDEALRGLVSSLAGTDTAFAFVSDHGHIAAGGHGGWEPEVIRAPAVLGGAGVAMGVDGYIAQWDIAPTLAALHGLRTPLDSAGTARSAVVPHAPLVPRIDDLRKRMENVIVPAARSAQYLVEEAPAHTDVLESAEDVRDPVLDLRGLGDTAPAAEKAARERRARLPMALGLAAAALAVLAFVGAMSWRALLSALLGAATYFGVYNTLYFGVHGHRWSLSAFNSESLIQAFFNLRMAEAAVAALLGALVAAVVYPLLRDDPKGPRGRYLAGWLSLGVATVLVAQALLGVQVAWFLWAYGADVTWVLPYLTWGFKYDLDLVQITALGGAGLLAPVVTYLAGRYHPRVRMPRGSEERAAA